MLEWSMRVARRSQLVSYTDSKQKPLLSLAVSLWRFVSHRYWTATRTRYNVVTASSRALDAAFIVDPHRGRAQLSGTIYVYDDCTDP